jgi:ubiquinone/menaquinone biosynthesis C-methylase UbiE
MIDVHLKYLEHFAELPGSTVVDVGCGDGSVVRALAERKAHAIGIAPAGPELDAARTRSPRSKRIRYKAGTPDALPLDDGSADLVTTLFTFGILTAERHPAALREARRVLRPGGRLHMVEPFAEGPYFELIRLVDDPTERRAQTIRSISATWEMGLKPLIAGSYIHLERFADFEDFRARLTGDDEVRSETFALHERTLRDTFDRLGVGDGSGGVVFRQPCRLYHFGRVEITEQAA